MWEGGFKLFRAAELILRQAQDDGGGSFLVTIQISAPPVRGWSFDELRMTRFFYGT
jgi:hypothetical protein